MIFKKNCKFEHVKNSAFVRETVTPLPYLQCCTFGPWGKNSWRSWHQSLNFFSKQYFTSCELRHARLKSIRNRAHSNLKEREAKDSSGIWRNYKILTAGVKVTRQKLLSILKLTWCYYTLFHQWRWWTTKKCLILMDEHVTELLQTAVTSSVPNFKAQMINALWLMNTNPG